VVTPDYVLRLVALVVGAAMAIVGGFLARDDGGDTIGWPLAIFGGFVVIGALAGPEWLTA
jgi:hypothetical protein